MRRYTNAHFRPKAFCEDIFRGNMVAVLIIPNHGNAIWDSGGDSPGQMPVQDFRIKTLLAYSATPDS